MNLHRSGTVIDEVSAAYHCGSSPESTTRGIHFVSREKMNTWVNCERDSCVTGNGALHLEDYSFVHQVYGQLPAILKVLRPEGLSGSIGFAKRFGIGFYRKGSAEPDQGCETAKELLADFHDWLCQWAIGSQRFPYLDNLRRANVS